MAPAVCTIQAPLRKFLYGARAPLQSPPVESDASFDFSQVKQELLGGDTPSDSDCAVDEAKSTPAKPSVPDVIVLGSVSVAEAEAKRKRRKNYEAMRHFQDSWAAKLPWAESVVGIGGTITEVRCKICTDVEGREKLLVPKIDGLFKHAGRRRAMADMGKIKRGEYYYLGQNQHIKNERVWFARGGQTIITKVLAGVTKERRRKMIQMKVCLHVLMHGRLMTEYSSMQKLALSLSVPDIPKKHWSQGGGWDFAIAMAKVCSEKLKRGVSEALYISASADEVTSVDNQQWLSVHVYYCVNYVRESHLICIRRVDCDANAANLTEMILDQIGWHGGVSDLELAQKLICFGADGAAVFQGSRSGVISRLQSSHAPYVIGVHDFAHRTNLAVEALSGLPFVQKLERLCKNLHLYFAGSPKRHLALTKLAEIVETEGLNILKQVQTRWISLLEPLKRIQGEYKALIAKFAEDAPKETVAKTNLQRLLDVTTVFALPCILPLLESIQSLIKFAQSRHVFVSDFIAAVKICQHEIFEMYVDDQTAFGVAQFELFHDVVGDHSHTIQHEWVTDLNDGHETLGFRVNNHTHPAHVVDPVSGRPLPVSRSDLAQIVTPVKGQCTAAAEMLIQQLDKRFPDSEVMEALGIIFPQYWLQEKCDELFVRHLEVLKAWFCTTRSIGSSAEGNVRQVIPSLDWHLLSMQQCLFKLTMKGNAQKSLEPPHDVNPVTRLWQRLGCNALLMNKLSEYMKLANIAVTAVLGSCEDERTFSTLSFVKSKLRNRLGGNLDTAIRLYSQTWFDVDTFPYAAAFDHWREARE